MPDCPDSRRGTRRLVLALILGFVGGVRGEEPGISVEQTPPRIVRRVYDPQNPPAEMLRQLKLPEAGLCQYDFGCKVLIGTDPTGVELQLAGATVTSVRLVMHLDITIWTVIESTPKLCTHEEGHREICEDYYGRAHRLALELASRALGTKLAIPLFTVGTAAAVVREAFQAKLAAEFIRETAERCIVANSNYDDLTAHGSNQVAEADAVAKAVTEERARSDH